MLNMKKESMIIPVFCREFENQLELQLPRGEDQLRRFRSHARIAASRVQLSRKEASIARRKSPLSGLELLGYFRSRERNTISARIIAYMETFLDGLPDTQATRREPVDPFRQFRGFVGDLVAQLEAEDVQAAVVRELGGQGRITPNNQWYYTGRMQESSKLLLQRLGQAGEAVPSHWRIVFEILKDFARFWFCLRNGESRRIRLSDKVIYQLATLLIRRIQDDSTGCGNKS